MKNSFHYTIYWQAKNTFTEGNVREQESFFALRNFIVSELVNVGSIIEKNNSEFLQKQMQILRGALSPYLSTVLQSDSSDINKIILEALHSIDTFSVTPVLVSTSQILTNSAELPLQKKNIGLLKSLVARGKKQLSERGISFSKNISGIYSTTFFIDEVDSVTQLKNIVSKYLALNTAENDLRFLPVCNSLAKVVRIIESPKDKQTHTLCLSLSSQGVVEELSGILPTLSSEFSLSNIYFQIPQPFSIVEQLPQLHCNIDLTKYSIGEFILKFNLFGDKKTKKTESLIITKLV
jgi:hypothetical protein